MFQKICANCGELEEFADDKVMWKCPKCGKDNIEGKRFFYAILGFVLIIIFVLWVISTVGFLSGKW